MKKAVASLLFLFFAVGAFGNPLPNSTIWVTDSAGQLFTVNLSDGAILSEIGAPSTVMFDIAMSPSGTLYGIGDDSYLYQLNPTTAEATQIAYVEAYPILIDFSKDGKLYAADYNNLVYRIDPQTGETIKKYELPENYVVSGGIAPDGKGSVYVVTSDFHLVKMDSELSTHTDLGMLDLRDEMYGMLFAEDGNLYGFSLENKIYRIDITALKAEQVGSVDASVNGVWGLTTDWFVKR